jgi:hypothetical protein
MGMQRLDEFEQHGRVVHDALVGGMGLSTNVVFFLRVVPGTAASVLLFFRRSTPGPLLHAAAG